MITWSKELPSQHDEVGYNHLDAETPLGRIRIEWKGWKERPQFDAMTPWGHVNLNAETPAEAREEMQELWHKKMSECAAMLRPAVLNLKGVIPPEKFEEFKKAWANASAGQWKQPIVISAPTPYCMECGDSGGELDLRPTCVPCVNRMRESTYGAQEPADAQDLNYTIAMASTALEKKTCTELADLLLEHVWAHLDMTDPKCALVAAAIDRLKLVDEAAHALGDTLKKALGPTEPVVRGSYAWCYTGAEGMVYKYRYQYCSGDAVVEYNRGAHGTDDYERHCVCIPEYEIKDLVHLLKTGSKSAWARIEELQAMTTEEFAAECHHQVLHPATTLGPTEPVVEGSYARVVALISKAALEHADAQDARPADGVFGRIHPRAGEEKGES